MDGLELAGRLRSQRPSIAVLHMSGYGEDVLRERGLRPEEARLLRKPFTSDDLARRLREALDAAPAGGAVQR
jgi:CheY-like chemotaxis protein